jgi:hypothetical protein
VGMLHSTLGNCGPGLLIVVIRRTKGTSHIRHCERSEAISS